MEQAELIDQHGAERESRGADEAFGRDLSVGVEDALKVLVEVFHRQRAQLVKHASNLDACVGVRVRAVLAGYQDQTAMRAVLTNIRRVVVGVL